MGRGQNFAVAALAAVVGLAAAHAGAGEPAGTGPAPVPHSVPVFRAVERALFERLPLQHQQMLATFAASEHCTPVAICFAPDTPEETVNAFLATAVAFGPQFNAGTRWGPTALDPASTGTPGQRTTLTYSFVPDGTPIPNGVGEGDGVSNLTAYLNGIYGTPAAWQAVYAQIFARWSQLTGITYVFEPNDDGVTMVDAPGIPGVRGDLRLGGKFIDGNSGILAYNYFPQSGDMVIDTGDNFFTNTANNSLALRNVLAHEHGHGMGLFHVCPVDQTKLMEPFVSTNYDGPRHDDIRGSHSLYGDPLEPNNSLATATDVGALAAGVPLEVGTPAAPAIDFGSRISISVTGDEDWFRFSVNSGRVLTATLRPVGLGYADTFQSGNCTVHSGSCCPGTVTNSATQTDLSLEIRSAAGAVLGQSSVVGAGLDDVVTDLCLSPGTYYARVFSPAGTPEAQLYSLTLQGDVAPIRVRPATTPTTLAPGAGTTVDVVVTACGESLVNGSALLRYRTVGGSFQSAPLAPFGGVGRFRATIPAQACGTVVEYYFEARGSGGTLAVSPAGAPGATYRAVVGAETTIFADDFETDRGWTVTNDGGLTDGAWERGVPAGEGGRYDPVADADGSGSCYLTANRIGNSDVDGAATRLVSPVMAAPAGSTGARVTYARWFRDSVFDGDRFTAEVSNNGGATWTVLESVGDVQGWNQVTATIPLALTSQMRFRFSASDVNPQSVVEAGLDAFAFRAVSCPAAPACDPDVNQDGNVDQGDVDYIINVVAGGANPTGIDPDFNRDGNADQSDVDALLNVVAGGNCP